MKSPCDQNHRIDLSNICSGEIISQTIFQLHGKIINFDCSNQLSCVSVENEVTATRFDSSEIKRNGNDLLFKCLIELKVGQNDLMISYCTSSIRISVINAAPTAPNYILRLLYVICTGHDGSFQSNDSDNDIESACQRINLAVRLIQTVISAKLFAAQNEHKTFQFVDCVPFHSSLTIDQARQMNGLQLWQYHAEEFIANEIECDRHVKYFGVLAATHFNGKQLSAHSAYGVGDVAIYGGTCLFSLPTTIDEVCDKFRDSRKVDKTKLFDDSNGRGTYGGCFATMIGAVCHEIGHIFDLGHTRSGIMGIEFDFVDRFFTFDATTITLPKRKLPMCLAETTNESRDGRLTQIRKTNDFLSSYHKQRESDLTTFDENSLVMLFYHKWFNQPTEDNDHDNDDSESEIKMNSENVIQSKWPIKLIEIRKKFNGLCEKYFTFSDTETYEFQLENFTLKNELDLIVMDAKGNLKRLNRD